MDFNLPRHRAFVVLRSLIHALPAILVLMCPCESSAAPLGPSGLIEVPTTTISETTSYETIGDLKYLRYSKVFLLNNLEAGGMREMSGADDSFIFYGKMRLLPEAGILPLTAAGIASVGSSSRDPSYFISMSKDLFSLGRLHFGALRSGKFKALPGSEPATDLFGGLELKVFGIATVIGEYYREKLNLGLRFNLGPGFFVGAYSRDYETNRFTRLDYHLSYGMSY